MEKKSGGREKRKEGGRDYKIQWPSLGSTAFSLTQ